jgi:hypothetical protein
MFAAILVVIAIAVIVGFALVAARATRGRRASPYALRNRFLTAAERSFYGVLREAVGTRYLVFAKVRLADVLRVRPGVSEPQGHLNRIIAKHVDFLLCEPREVSPVLVIELDDASHGEERRQTRDQFVDAAVEGAGLPLLRIHAARAYDPKLLARRIAEIVDLPNDSGDLPNLHRVAMVDGDD